MTRTWAYPYSWNDGEIVHLSERTVIVPAAWRDPEGKRPPLYGIEEDWAEGDVRGIVVGADGGCYISVDGGPTGSEVMAMWDQEAD